MLRLAIPLMLLVAFPLAAAAHPLPNTHYDRTVAIRFSPDRVVVKYALEVSQLTIFLDGAKLFTPQETYSSRARV